MNILRNVFKKKNMTPLGRWGVPAEKRLSNNDIYDHSFSVTNDEKWCECIMKHNITYCSTCFCIVKEPDIIKGRGMVAYLPYTKCKMKAA